MIKAYVTTLSRQPPLCATQYVLFSYLFPGPDGINPANRRFQTISVDTPDFV